MRSGLLICLIGLLTLNTALAQTIAVEGSDSQKAYEAQYQKNIKLSKINGVYIPATLDEAFRRIKKLTPESAIQNFKAAPEAQVCKRLHFGIGRWMIENWSFYTGSRISHLLKTKGILHPDDMAQFLLRSFHRSLNGLDSDEAALIEELAIERKRIGKEALGL